MKPNEITNPSSFPPVPSSGIQYPNYSGGTGEASVNQRYLDSGALQQMTQGTQPQPQVTEPVPTPYTAPTTAGSFNGTPGTSPSASSQNSNSRGVNPMEFQDMMMKMDSKMRNIQGLQEQKNALLDTLYKPTFSEDIMAKLTPDQAEAVRSGRRDLIDHQVRSINNQIDGRYAAADSAIKYFNNREKQDQDYANEVLKLAADPEGLAFLKNNGLTQDGIDRMKNFGFNMNNIGQSNDVSQGTVAQRNNNPGNLRGHDGNFQKYGSVEEGKQAWLKDFTAKATGNTRTGLNSNSTLAQFVSVYAPASDNNNVEAYIKSLESAGIPRTATLGQILSSGKAPMLGEAMFKHEGFYNQTPAQKTAGQKEKYKDVLLNIIGRAGLTKDDRANITQSLSESSDPLQVIKTNAKTMMPDKGNKLLQVDIAYEKMNEVKKAYDEYYAKGLETGYGTGMYENGLRVFGRTNDPELIKLKTATALALQDYRHAMSGTAYSDAESKEISSVFPQISNTKEVNDAVMKQSIDMMQKYIGNQYRYVLGNKQYSSLKDELEADIATELGTYEGQTKVAKEESTNLRSKYNY